MKKLITLAVGALLLAVVVACSTTNERNIASTPEATDWNKHFEKKFKTKDGL